MLDSSPFTFSLCSISYRLDEVNTKIDFLKHSVVTNNIAQDNNEMVFEAQMIDNEGNDLVLLTVMKLLQEIHLEVKETNAKMNILESRLMEKEFSQILPILKVCFFLYYFVLTN